MSDSTRETIIAMHLDGKTNGQIRHVTGLSRGTIGGHIDRWRKDKVKNPTHHQLKPYAPSMMERSNPSYDKERDAEQRHRENDRRFVVELAKAFQRGDHLTKGTIPELRLIG